MIVCMSRRICVDALRRDRRAAAGLAQRRRRQGRAQGRDDRLGLRPARLAAAHPQQDAPRGAGEAVPRPDDPFKIVIVRDMWLTGFDAPCLHTMYVDKPMRGHGLMQAIARVNRVFKDKPGGLVVDYLGLADELQAGARDLHRERRHGQDRARPGRGRRADAGEVRGLLRRSSTASTGRSGLTGTPQQRLVAAAGGAGAHPRAGRRQGPRCCRRSPSCRRRSRWPCRTTRRCAIRDDVGFFQAVRAVLAKSAPGERKTDEDLDHAIRQIVSKAVVVRRGGRHLRRRRA